VSILPLPIFERDADPAFRDALTDAEQYARLRPPTSIVVRFGSLKMVGEYPYDGDAKPGCGSRLVARTHRGTELAEMLTTTCPNSGCGKSVSRRDMLEYIGNSGGKDYPFHTNGRILRVATVEDLNRWSALRARFGKEEVLAVREIVAGMGLAMKVVEVEPILGGELVAVHYTSEERVDFREAVPVLARRFGARVEMHQIGARDEARITADYEKCGQYCCCKNFLKVLKPVSMRSAKTQKASLDPLKISGRCGRLMCCLRYEDETYEELQKRLPRLKSRVGTVDGPGTVVDTKILVQLVLVRLDSGAPDIAVPVEDLLPVDACPPGTPPAPGKTPAPGSPRARGGAPRGGGTGPGRDQRRPPAAQGGGAAPHAAVERAGAPHAPSPVPPAAPVPPHDGGASDASPPAPAGPEAGDPARTRRRRRPRRNRGPKPPPG
jgi:cell fate regulator YaaT (PSP1 superfamily)